MMNYDENAGIAFDIETMKNLANYAGTKDVNSLVVAAFRARDMVQNISVALGISMEAAVPLALTYSCWSPDTTANRR